MNELQVKTIEIEPAVIKFNHEEIEKELETNLKKYEGLVFTEEGATDLRKTIAELRKGKNAVDRYRIDTKKKLNEPVKQFEDKCKQLDAKFENVIIPLVEQQNEFETTRKAQKQAELEAIRLDHINTLGLDEAYHNQVIIDDSMLTKSASLKQSSDSIKFQVEKLKMEQDKKAADTEIIITTVRLANSENGLSLSADAYVRFLEFTPVERIKNQIETDVKTALQKREREQAEKERKEKEEQERLEREKQAELEQLEQKEDENTFEQVPPSSSPESVSIDDIPFADVPFEFEEDPFPIDEFIDDPFEEKTITKVYRVTATESAFKRIEHAMNDIDVENFEVIDK